MTMTTKELLALVGRWRDAYGDYPESKRDCADELAPIATALCAEVEAKDERIAQQDATIARLAAALAGIRDSTFRNATTLRGMADRALTKDTP